MLALACSRSSVPQTALTNRSAAALAGFCSALPDGATSRLEEHLSPAEGGWLRWQRAAGTARGQLPPRSWRKLLGSVPRFQPRAMPLQSAQLYEVLQEQRLLPAARPSPRPTPVLWLLPGKSTGQQRCIFSTFSFDRRWRKETERSILVHQPGREANTTGVIPAA